MFSRHRKSQDAWAHRYEAWASEPPCTIGPTVYATGFQFNVRRRYVLERGLAATAEADARQALLAHELQVCTGVADVYPKIYMGWTYRHWIVQQLDDAAALEAEVAAGRAWLRRHVSDHAAAQHHQGVLCRLSARLGAVARRALAAVVAECWLRVPAPPADELDRVRALWVAEWELLNDLQSRYPGHEALWCHRRFLAAASLAMQPLFSSDPLGTVDQGRGPPESHRCPNATATLRHAHPQWTRLRRRRGSRRWSPMCTSSGTTRSAVARWPTSSTCGGGAASGRRWPRQWTARCGACSKSRRPLRRRAHERTLPLYA